MLRLWVSVRVRDSLRGQGRVRVIGRGWCSDRVRDRFMVRFG